MIVHSNKIRNELLLENLQNYPYDIKQVICDFEDAASEEAIAYYSSINNIIVTKTELEYIKCNLKAFYNKFSKYIKIQ